MTTTPAGEAAKLAAPFRPMLPADRWEWPTKNGYIRAVLYVDSINGEQTCRDDLWLAITEALRSIAAPAALPEVLQQAKEALEQARGFISSDYTGHGGKDYSGGALAKIDAALSAITALMEGKQT